MKLTSAIQPPDDETMCTVHSWSVGDFIASPPSGVFELPNENENRLIPPLRAAAKTQDPLKILARAAAAMHMAPGLDPQRDYRLAYALADLAVTGRMAYAAFQKLPLLEASLQEVTRLELLASSVQATPAEVANAVSIALDRAYTVAWTLRGPAAQQAEARASLGGIVGGNWIAVSGEDDKPHRPTNFPPPQVKQYEIPFEQYEIPVTAHGVTLQTRFFIASPAEGTPPTGNPRSLRELPPDPQPHVPDGHQVILFLHGHSSGAEEALTIIPHIHRAGLEHNTKFSIISLDLPNNGYSQSFSHTSVAPSGATTFPGDVLDRHTPIRTPVIDFIEDFIVAFVDALDRITPIKNRFAGVIGGSLGGNMGLRLGRRDLFKSPWLRAAGIVSWDPASVWDPLVQDILKSRAPFHCFARWGEAETVSSRRNYFIEVFDQPALGSPLDVFFPDTQPDMWYRNGWEPCKSLHISESRANRSEIYDGNFRQWHWRVAGEQLIYSHVDRVDHSDESSPFRYRLNKVSQLLVAGEMDNYPGSRIYNATRELARKMVDTLGRSLFLRDTGHSIHVERPGFLAGQIVDFLTAPPTSMQITCIHRDTKNGPIRSVGGINRTQNVWFQMTTEECILSIGRGSEFFVVGAGGSRAAVQVVIKGGGVFIETVGDNTLTNNLDSLPECGTVDDAEFASQTLPLSIVSGAMKHGKIVMTNTGTSVWEVGKHLLNSIPIPGSQIITISPTAVTSPVSPLQHSVFTFDITGGQSGTKATLICRMMKGGQGFGEESEEATIVFISASEPAQCETIRKEMVKIQTTIANLEERLDPAGDPQAAAKIRKAIFDAKGELAAERHRGSQLQCTLP